MSNLYKGSYYYSGETKARVIDSNEAVSAKIIEIKNRMKQNAYGEKNPDKAGFIVGLDAKDVQELISEDVAENADDEGIRLSADIEYMLNNADMQAKSIIDKARYDAAMMLTEAKKEADELKRQAMEEGTISGYEEGLNKGKGEIEQLRNQLLSQKKEMELEYNQLVENIEPQLVETILEVFSNITNVISYDKKDIILSLVNSVMSGDDVGNNYIIRVSSEDVKFLRDNKDKIEKMSRKDIHIEIVEDMSLKKNQCLIDTDMGIFDASLDIQLESLVNDIKILSCMGKDI